MEGFICSVCKVKYKEGKTFHSVLCSNGLYVPTCSIDCFNLEKQKQIKNAELNLKEIQEQLPHIEVW